MNLKFLKTFAKPSIIQPVLTVVLVLLLVVLIAQYIGGRTNGTVQRELTRKVELTEAVNNYLTGSYEVYTRGSLIVKNSQTASLNSGSIDPSQSTKTEDQKVAATENKYDDLFFYLDKGTVKRLDLKTFGQNETLFFDTKGQINFISNTNKAYSVYPVPADGEKDAALLFDSTKKMMEDTLPLVPLLRDYQNKKFNPVERATNLYSGKWQHPLFTSDEITDVILETDPYSGIFTSVSFVHAFASTYSRIVFDFKKTDLSNNILTIPEGYRQVPIEIKYKAREQQAA